MKPTRVLLASGLLLALIAAGCGIVPGQGPGATPIAIEPTAAPTTAPTSAPTTAPTAAPTSEPTAAPTAAPTAVPTSEPTAAPTAAPTAPPAQALLPLDSAWVGVPGALLADKGGLQALRPQERGLPAPAYFAAVAENGSALVYSTDQGGVILFDMASGDHTVLSDGSEIITGASFSPDGNTLAYARIRQERWALELLDRAAGTTRALQEGYVFPQNGPSEGVLAPLAWNASGLLAQRLIWGSDAPPFGLSLVDLNDGSVQVLRDESYVAAYPARDGSKVALVTGQIVLGPGPSELGLTVFDLQTGEREIVPQSVGWISAVSWSPDGSQLLYHRAPESPVTMLVIVNADGSGERAVMLGAGVEGIGNNARFKDAAWTSQGVPLLLTASPDDQLRLFALTQAPQELAGFGQLAESGAPARIVRAP